MKIIISAFSFEITAPYSAGHTLSEPEAQALNSLRADRVRELVRKRLARMLAPGEAEIAALVAEVDGEWTFEARRAAPAPRISRFEVELALVAEEEARVEFNARGRVAEGPDFENYITELSKLSRLREEAQRRLAFAGRVAGETLEDLLT